MSFIDPEGMFGGDRMAMLSDSAKMAWPWFWCASNTVGRVELNYRVFASTVFRQFKKPPTEAAFWEWVSEYHESFLMFVYQRDGKVWGQWDAGEKLLPKYKTKADEATPCPTAREWLDWRKQYGELKEKQLSGKCRVLNVSEKFQIISDGEKNSPIGVGIGVGVEVGIGVGKTHTSPKSGEGECVSDSLFAVDKPAARALVYGKSWFDERHEVWYSQAFWNHTGKAASRKAYERIVRALANETSTTFENVAELLLRLALDDRRRFEPVQAWSWRRNMHPATWLNARRWTDEANKDPPRVSKGATLEEVSMLFPPGRRI